MFVFVYLGFLQRTLLKKLIEHKQHGKSDHLEESIQGLIGVRPEYFEQHKSFSIIQHEIPIYHLILTLMNDGQSV